jgi:glutathione-regulated potassium-efflux system ancillary protein KefC/glutathione-regulated potassium-efflux system protein KefB
MSLLGQSAIFLGAAVVAVPLFKRFGLGAVLGPPSATSTATIGA